MTPLPKHLEEMREDKWCEFNIKHSWTASKEECFKAGFNQAASLMLKDMESIVKALERYENVNFNGLSGSTNPAREALKIWREKYKGEVK